MLSIPFSLVPRFWPVKHQRGDGSVVQAEALADRLAILCEGQLVFHGTPLTLKHEADSRGEGAT